MYTELAVFALAETVRQQAHSRASEHRTAKATRRGRRSRRSASSTLPRRRPALLRLRQAGEAA
jgi:hypothetical protein